MPSAFHAFLDLPALIAVGETALVPAPTIGAWAYGPRPSGLEPGARERMRKGGVEPARVVVAPAVRPEVATPDSACVGEAFRLQYHLLRERRRAAAAARRVGAAPGR